MDRICADTAARLDGKINCPKNWITHFAVDLEVGRGHSAFMARKFCVEYPGTIAPITSRSGRREGIVRDKADRQLFLDARRGLKP